MHVTCFIHPFFQTRSPGLCPKLQYLKQYVWTTIIYVPKNLCGNFPDIYNHQKEIRNNRYIFIQFDCILLDSFPEWIYQWALPLVYKILNALLPPPYTCIIRCLIFAKFLGQKLCFIFVYSCISVILTILTISFCSYLPFVITVNVCSYFCPFGHWQFSRSILLLCKLLRVS